MDPKVKANLKENFFQKCDRFNLDELIQHTYVRQYNEKLRLSANDMAYSIASLLEHPTKLEEAFASNSGSENANPNQMQQNKNAFHSNKYN
jgi:hypothetical protein